MSWEIKIGKSKNGYKVFFKDEEADCEMVYQEKSDMDETDKDHVLTMLYDVLEYFGESGSKYDKRRIFLGYRVGSKYEGKEDPKKGIGFDCIDEEGI